MPHSPREPLLSNPTNRGPVRRVHLRRKDLLAHAGAAWLCEVNGGAVRDVVGKRPQAKGRLREPVNGLTHLAGGLLAVVGLVVLLATAASAGRVDQLVAFGIFGLSLVALYTASTLYHLLPLSPSGVARLRRLDHVAIFVLIAGTYTPFCLLAIGGAWRWGLLVLIWGLALCGVLLKVLWMDAPRWLSVVLYLSMGWVAVVAAPALLQAVPAGGMAWVLAGGLIYSAGALVYGFKRPNPIPGSFGFHEVWHVFVVAGSACHFWAVLHYVAPLA
jgi:hemolysin III